jgi:3-oxoacyl-ACP reductase-like protein
LLANQWLQRQLDATSKKWLVLTTTAMSLVGLIALLLHPPLLLASFFCLSLSLAHKMERLNVLLRQLTPEHGIDDAATHARASVVSGSTSSSAPASSRPKREPVQTRHIRELFNLSGRVAIVSGGASGIGTQMSEALAEAGANVVVCARNAERCQQYANALAAATGVKCIGLGVCNYDTPP